MSINVITYTLLEKKRTNQLIKKIRNSDFFVAGWFYIYDAKDIESYQVEILNEMGFDLIPKTFFSIRLMNKDKAVELEKMTKEVRTFFTEIDDLLMLLNGEVAIDP